MGSLRRAAPPFRGRRSRVTVNLGEAERHLVARLLDEVAGMLERDAEPGRDETSAADAGPDGDLWRAFEQSVAVDPPSDPAVARLLPDGNRDDAELAQSFRRLTEHSLRQTKRAGLALAADALRRPEPVVLDREEAGALLKGLTDVRLVLAERLDLRTDDDATTLHLRLELASAQAAEAEEPDEPDPAAQAERSWLGLAAVYEALTWWQESLVAAVH